MRVPRPARDATATAVSFVVATIYYFDREVDSKFTARFEKEMMPVFERSGARVLARYVSDKSRNTFERLPVRETENAFVWFAAFADRAAYDRYIAKLAQEVRWRDELFAYVQKAVQRPPETLMLQPTARSLVR